MGRVRRMVILATLAVAIGGPGGADALAADPPPLLTNQSIASNAFTPGLVPGPGTNIHVTSTCDLDGTSTVAWTGTGTATGPYPGTMTVSGTATIGPQTYLGGLGQPRAPGGLQIGMDVEFTIDSPNGSIAGSVHTDSGFRLATCTDTPFLDGSTPLVTWERAVDVSMLVPYDVTVTTSSGTTELHGQLFASLTEMAWTDRGYQFGYCDTANLTCSQQAFGLTFYTSWYDPATVTVDLTSDATLHLGWASTFSATVRDSSGAVIDGIPLVARVEGSTEDQNMYCIRTGGNQPGQCEFSYVGRGEAGTDLITVCPDGNSDGLADPGSPCGSATQTWLAELPPPILHDDSGTIDGAAGGTAIADVLANDTRGDGTPLPRSEIAYFASYDSPSGIWLDGDTGAVNVDPGKAPGVYTFTYFVNDFLSTYTAGITVTVTSSDGDADDDGVSDAIQTAPGAFSDSSISPPTVGSIANAAGNSVLVADAPAPEGVHITVSGSGSAKSTITICGFATLQLLPGSDIVVTCGSVTVRVTAGPAELALRSGAVLVSIPAGVTAKVTDTGGGGFGIQHLAGSGGVAVTTNGTRTTVAPGQTSSVDATPPVVVPTITGTLGANGWYRSNVTVSWSVSDGQSLISARVGCVTSSIASDTTGVTRTCAATSRGGTTTVSVTVKRDATAPSLSFASHPATYTVDQIVSFGCTASDATSGIPTACSPVNAAAYTFAIGSNTVSRSVQDRAGNTRTASTSFTVRVTAASLCTLTRQFVRGSARYQTANASQRAVAELALTAGCAALNARQVSLYRAAVTSSATGGWLTAEQATTLRALADRL